MASETLSGSMCGLLYGYHSPGFRRLRFLPFERMLLSPRVREMSPFAMGVTESCLARGKSGTSRLI